MYKALWWPLLKGPYHVAPYQEWDFDFMARWGFDFVRLATDYAFWTVSSGVYREQPLKGIDQAVAWARARGIHVNLALHGAPGYRHQGPEGSLNLWAEGEAGEEARRQFALQWRMFAARYRGIPGHELSFNLVNEPPDIPGERYLRVASAAVEAIRAEDPARLIIADGANYGRRPVPDLVPLRVAQSTRGYTPMLSFYQAPFISGADSWPIPVWPEMRSSKETLWREQVEPWRKFADTFGIGVHIGEWGAYNRTPHGVVLAWAKDCLENWKQAGIGWALWNLRGEFGILDSQRADVAYENYQGHKLDRKMLEMLLQG